MSVVGDQIRILRWDKRMKQGELARRAGLSQNSVSSIENGKSMPSVGTVVRIARALGVPPSDLLEAMAAEEVADEGKAAAPTTVTTPPGSGQPLRLEFTDSVAV